MITSCWIIALMVSVAATKSGDVEEYCNMETFEATCADDEVILMKSARYGRMQMGRCVSVNYGNIGCAVDVLWHADTRCSGKRNCQIKLPDDTLYDTQPCNKDVTPYLEASYQCVKVSSGASLQQQCSHAQKVRLTSESGLISSLVSRELNIGAFRCPWVIQVSPGQKVNVTLLDFSVTTSSSGLNPDGQNPLLCHKYAVIQEKSVLTPTTICSGNQRTRNVYISESNTIEITLVNSDELSSHHFLIRYSAIGCADLNSPPFTSVVRNVNKAVVTCLHTGEKWFLVCDESKWVGRFGNCSGPPDESNGEMWTSITGKWSTPYGILVVIGLGVALGIILGFVLLAIVLYYMRRRKRSHSERSYSEPYDDFSPQPQESDCVKYGCVVKDGNFIETNTPPSWKCDASIHLKPDDQIYVRSPKQFPEGFTYIESDPQTGTLRSFKGTMSRKHDHLYERPT